MKITLPILSIGLILLTAGCVSNNQVTRQAAPQAMHVEDGQVFDMEAAPLKHRIGGTELDMYAYNGQIPGPTIRARQGDTIYINFTNKLGEDTTIHWHGIRLENSFDGVPDISQAPIKPGESFLYKINLPDYGVYWYHPHIREDKQQELGLYGNIIVEKDGVFAIADDELVLILDDIRISGDKIDTFYNDFTRFALMGRYGNNMLVNGQTGFQAQAKKGRVRIYLTNAANARPFNFSIEGHVLRIVGGDSGRYEREFAAESVVISPGERYIIEVLFNKTGSFEMRNIHPEAQKVIGRIHVIDNTPMEQAGPTDIVEFDSIKEYATNRPDFEFELTMETGGMGHEGHGSPASTGSTAPIEWEDDMGMMNVISTDRNTRWIIKDVKTGKENEDIVSKVRLGDVKMIRIFNNPKSMHPMQHPMHLHGQRFVILSENNKTNDNFVWKDTVLVQTGATTDILVNFTNPGTWMFHCHIAEHLEAGMMTIFEVSA